MRNKVKGIIFLILGFYLFSVNPIISILFDTVRVVCSPTPYGSICTPVDPINYLRVWLMQHGWYTILIALGGLLLIIIGSRYLVLIKKLDNYEIF